MKISVILIDDERSSHETMELALSGWRSGNLHIAHAYSPAEAAATVAKESFQIALVDLHYGAGDPKGFSLLEKLREIDAGLELIVVSSAGEFEYAQSAMRAGAGDFLVKGFGRTELFQVLERALERRRWRRMEKQVAQKNAAEIAGFSLVGGSAATEKMKNELRRVADKGVPVLLEGETGSGKEIAARALHVWGSDPAGPFVAVNCAAIPASTADSYFFGHERGAFTGAERAREGVFEEASGGTLFLDEVNSLPLEMQGRLLRVLQEKEVRRMGSTKNIPVEFRLVAAANRPLQELVGEGSFREDLFYRLSVVAVRVPPLRERKEDIPSLAAFFAPTRVLSPELQVLLQTHSWPGNIRECRNLLQAMDALADLGDELTVENLPEQAFRNIARIMPSAAPDIAEGEASAEAFASSQEEREIAFLRRAYENSGGNVSRLSRMLSVDRSHLHQKLTKYGIHRAKS